MSSISPDIVTNGLVLCLDAADKKSYSGSGTTWNDRSGNGYDGTLSGGVSFDSSRGGVLDFDGVDDKVAIPNSTNLQEHLRVDQTVCILMKLDPTYTSGRRNPIHKNYSGEISVTVENATSASYYWGGNQNNVDSGGGDDEGGGYCNSSTSMADGWFEKGNDIWVAYTVVRDIGNADILAYINGILRQEKNACTPNTKSKVTSDELQIGTGYAGWWFGQIASVRIYNRVLSASEVLQNFNAMKSRFGVT